VLRYTYFHLTSRWSVPVSSHAALNSLGVACSNELRSRTALYSRRNHDPFACASFTPSNSTLSRNSSRNRLSNDSIYPLSQGLAAAIGIDFAATPGSHSAVSTRQTASVLPQMSLSPSVWASRSRFRRCAASFPPSSPGQAIKRLKEHAYPGPADSSKTGGTKRCRPGPHWRGPRAADIVQGARCGLAWRGLAWAPMAQC